MGNNETKCLLPDSLLGRFTKPSESRISETTLAKDSLLLMSSCVPPWFCPTMCAFCPCIATALLYTMVILHPIYIFNYLLLQFSLIHISCFNFFTSLIFKSIGVASVVYFFNMLYHTRCTHSHEMYSNLYLPFSYVIVLIHMGSSIY